MIDELFLREFWVRFLAGVATSIVVGLGGWLARGLSKRWPLWSMEGLWLEVIQDNPLRYSLGDLRFSYFLGRHLYNGENYTRDTVPKIKFRWQTIQSSLDAEHSHFMYIYKRTEMDTSTHGFGFINLPDAGILAGRGDTTGYFADAEDRPMAALLPAVLHKHDVHYYRAVVVAKELRLRPELTPEDARSRQQFIQKLLEKNWNG